MALTDNLISYYKLDESSGNALDSTSKGFTLTNTNSVAYATGKINNGADFGSTNTNKTLIYTGDIGLTQNSDWTVSYWAKNSGTDTTGSFQFQMTWNANRYMYIFRDGANNRWTMDNGGGFFTQTVQSISNSTWYHVVVQRSGSTVYVRINDSALASTTAYTGTSGAITNAVKIGYSEFTGSYNKGMTDEVGIWSRALSAAEITSLYNAGAASSYPFGGNVVNTLVVGGGGGGGAGNGGYGGGGGAGGYVANSTFSVTPQAYTITVGTGATAVSWGSEVGNSGGTSTFSTLSATGGGGGAGGNGSVAPASGGSGGGGRSFTSPGNGSGAGTAGQGNNGGTAANSAGGGGGGASSVGAAGVTVTGGNGGSGTANSISGSSVTYAGGGGASGSTTNGTGGSGGGGTGANGGAANNGTNGLGGGGGGNINTTAGAGGSGVVIIAYKTDGSDGVSTASTGGTITTSGANTIHTFTTSGTWTMVAAGGAASNSKFLMFM
jgi:hypothetical protein